MARNKSKSLRIADLFPLADCRRGIYDCALKIAKLLLKSGPIIGLVSCIVMTPTRGLAEAALAYGHYGNGGWASGTAHNYRTSLEAQNQAMSNCNAKGSNCTIRITFNNTCVALAVQNGWNGWGTGLNPNINEARRMALARCAQYGRSCSVQTAFCDNVSEAAIREAEQEKARRAREIVDEAARQAMQRVRDAENAAREAELRAQHAEEAARTAVQNATSISNASTSQPDRNIGLHIPPNSNMAVGAGLILVSSMAWAFSLATKALSGDKPSFGRQVAVQSIAAIISGIVLYHLGIVNEIKLLAVPLVGGLSLALYSSIKFA